MSRLLSVPTVAAIVAVGGFLMYRKRLHTIQVSQSSLGQSNEKYESPIYQIFVDSPKNTLMRDDRPPTRTNLDDQLAAAFEMTKHTFLVEAQDDPRVQMVAHAVS